MWYEILPSFGIVVAAMGIPHLSAYVINKVAIGNFYRRRLLTEEEKRNYLRDTRLTNNPYTIAGLENIPDS
ncbi:PREDICTED: uncharacterized protein LOC108557158 [Nicrophorus vespilloides]|uniref:Uncharacterized protein LOC108557158 n=1 Tax=Nicrophorus vespilloides TaxID=110193 RepID=A0ABM1M3A7_NICVS|nr:PREDICTED: uncharacterized protein LOC108557158 [Nicrophorus vespilloides]